MQGTKISHVVRHGQKKKKKNTKKQNKVVLDGNRGPRVCCGDCHYNTYCSVTLTKININQMSTEGKKNAQHENCELQFYWETY